MKQYLDMLELTLSGTYKPNRTGVGAYSHFGHQARFNLQDGFPLVTTKKMFTKGIIYELLWMLNGDTNVGWLNDHNVKIWDAWADSNGDLGPVYGKQWRSWCVDDTWYIDQISEVIKDIRENPFSRRHIVSAWNVGDLNKMALAPCHCFFQFNVRPDAEGLPAFLDCQLYQRSADVFLGVPFNIASYSLLTMMIANSTGLIPGELIHTFGDLHLYENHVEQAKLQLTREPYELPTMKVCQLVPSIDDYCIADFSLENYKHHPHIKGDIAV